ncbi:hypothetical protein HBI24_183310 [Parastagonospora nodorum]|nr:hypothetical protein HBH42_201600 [Parastagonospora nodorum]KAH4898856.1 hypothetical protein HBI80_178490 [Parastagonospora nodorum]KAH5576636.1 hypothetical protein HBI24_183310 [Parastagonospora nodorum]
MADLDFDAVINREVGKPDDVHVEYHLNHFLSDYFSKIFDEQIAAANRGEEPEWGWPLTDMKTTHNRMVVAIDPTGIHWVTDEFVRATANEPAKLFY